MRISSALAAVLSLSACGLSEDAVTATPAVAACPLQLTTATSIPKGARIVGKVTGPVKLWAAELALGTPEGVTPGSGLNSVEQDDEGPLPGKRYRYHYELPSMESDAYMLACTYGVDVTSANNEVSRSRLLVPLPNLPTILCDVIRDVSDPNGKRKPLVSASCEAGK